MKIMDANLNRTKTLWVTTPQPEGKTGLRKDFAALVEALGKESADWRVEAGNFGSFLEARSTPDIMVVCLSHRTRPEQIKAMIPDLAHLQEAGLKAACSGYVVFTYEAGEQRWLNRITTEIKNALLEFRKPERVDLSAVSSPADLVSKLVLMEAKFVMEAAASPGTGDSAPTHEGQNAPHDFNEGVAPRKSALDEVEAVLKATRHLRNSNGKLSAEKIAEEYGVSVARLAGWIGRSRQSVNKTPDADSLQNDLAFFERVARLRTVLKQEDFRKWLNMPHAQLGRKTPLDVLAWRKGQVVADLVDDMLTGAPT